MNSEGFEYITDEQNNEPIEQIKENNIEEIKETKNNENEFLKDLPDWDLEPPYTVVRRRVS